MNLLIIIPSLGPIWKPALDSIMIQQRRDNQYFKDTFVLVVEDGYGEETLSPITDRWNYLVWRRKERNYAAKNIHDALEKSSMFNMYNRDVVAILDGDDELKKGAVQYLHHIFSNKNIWINHGSYVNKSNGIRGRFCRPYRTGCDFRDEKWKGSHLRAFRYGLVSRLPESCYKGPDEEWLRVCYDLGMMLPMFEMAGHDRINFCDKTLYIYNDVSELNDHKIRGQEQTEVDKWIRKQPKFERIDKISHSWNGS